MGRSVAILGLGLVLGGCVPARHDHRYVSLECEAVRTDMRSLVTNADETEARAAVALAAKARCVCEASDAP